MGHTSSGYIVSFFISCVCNVGGTHHWCSRYRESKGGCVISMMIFDSQSADKPFIILNYSFIAFVHAFCLKWDLCSIVKKSIVIAIVM